MRISDWSSDVCSSDLAVVHGYQDPEADLEGASPAVGQGVGRGYLHPDILRRRRARKHTPRPTRPARLVPRSEEHTSELQSLMRFSYAVFCLKNYTTQLC